MDSIRPLSLEKFAGMAKPLARVLALLDILQTGGTPAPCTSSLTGWVSTNGWSAATSATCSTSTYRRTESGAGPQLLAEEPVKSSTALANASGLSSGMK